MSLDIPMCDPFKKEVLELHSFLEQWLKGEVDRNQGLGRLENALEDDFIIIHPSGTRAGKQDVIRSFKGAFDSKGPAYALEISNVNAKALNEGFRLVTYREDHRSEDGRTRISTALLRHRKERVTWLFLQETLISPES